MVFVYTNLCSRKIIAKCLFYYNIVADFISLYFYYINWCKFADISFLYIFIISSGASLSIFHFFIFLLFQLVRVCRYFISLYFHYMNQCEFADISFLYIFIISISASLSIFHFFIFSLYQLVRVCRYLIIDIFII